MTFGSIMLSLASEEEHDVYTIRNIDVTLTANGVRIRRRLCKKVSHKTDSNQ